jgi:hypothetical protein
MITVYWIPGQTDIPGNELAERLANKYTFEKPLTYYNPTLSYL